MSEFIRERPRWSSLEYFSDKLFEHGTERKDMELVAIAMAMQATAMLWKRQDGAETEQDRAFRQKLHAARRESTDTKDEDQ